MYRSFTPDQYRERLGFELNYKIDGMLCYGTLYEDKVLDILKETLDNLALDYTIKDMSDPFLRFAKELTINNKKLWFAIGYGGAWLSEYIHWACQFGSKNNILLGSCGGLKVGIRKCDFIVPTNSFGEESSVRIYNRESPNQYPNEALSEKLEKSLGMDGAKVWRGPIVTCQAMIGETIEDVEKWSKDGYYGVEMESATVFAVSNHFGVNSAASLYVGDNLIEGHNNISDEWLAGGDLRKQSQARQMKVALLELLS